MMAPLAAQLYSGRECVLVVGSIRGARGSLMKSFGPLCRRFRDLVTGGHTLGAEWRNWADKKEKEVDGRTEGM